jgi:rfaE bifunctional protein nucleotidyltransferase chain/domain
MDKFTRNPPALAMGRFNLVDILVSALTGKKTIVKFSSGDYDIRLAFLGRFNNAPEDFDEERMTAALKEGIQKTLAQFIAELKIVASSGCFDLLTAGHVHLFKCMREAAGRDGHTVILLNDDAYLRRAKGRVIVPLEQRMAVLLALRDVDMVIPFSDDTPCAIISKMEPTFWYKGPEYANIEIPETKIIESYGGELRFVEGGPDVHTSDIIREIKKVRKI